MGHREQGTEVVFTLNLWECKGNREHPLRPLFTVTVSSKNVG